MKKILLVLTLVLLLCGCQEKKELISPDENGMMRLGNTYIEESELLNDESVLKFTEKLNKLREEYFLENDVWYAVIPDKSYYAKEQISTFLDHDAMMKSIRVQLTEWNEIPISEMLTLDDFYLSDAHWRAERLLPTVKKMGEAMDFTIDDERFTENSKDGFVGAYGKKIDEPQGEAIKWLTSTDTENAVVENFEHPEITDIYDIQKLQSDNWYDMFLSGATPLTVICNPNAEFERELVIFRDSFASSITPLLTQAYSKITLVDLRYMMSSLLPQYVNFKDADILILYSAQVVNNSMLLRVQ